MFLRDAEEQPARPAVREREVMVIFFVLFSHICVLKFHMQSLIYGWKRFMGTPPMYCTWGSADMDNDLDNP